MDNNFLKPLFYVRKAVSSFPIFSTKYLNPNSFKFGLMFMLFFIMAVGAHAQLLWKVTGKGLKHPSYIFGTNARIPIQFLDSIPGLFKAFNASDVVVSELVLNNVDVSAQMLRAAIMPRNITMTDLLSAHDYNVVDAGLKSVSKISLAELVILHPAFIQSLYDMELYKKSSGFTDDVLSDSYFQLVAAQKGKETVGLDTFDQLAATFFQQGDLNLQASRLVNIIQKKDSVCSSSQHLIGLYRAGRIDELSCFPTQGAILGGQSEQEYKKNTAFRQVGWLAKLPSLFTNRRCFVAIDAAYLGGENGLLKRLRKAGYVVSAQ